MFSKNATKINSNSSSKICVLHKSTLTSKPRSEFSIRMLILDRPRAYSGIQCPVPLLSPRVRSEKQQHGIVLFLANSLSCGISKHANRKAVYDTWRVAIYVTSMTDLGCLVGKETGRYIKVKRTAGDFPGVSWRHFTRHLCRQRLEVTWRLDRPSIGSVHTERITRLWVESSLLRQTCTGVLKVVYAKWSEPQETEVGSI